MTGLQVGISYKLFFFIHLRLGKGKRSHPMQKANYPHLSPQPSPLSEASSAQSIRRQVTTQKTTPAC
jgi:hypothetical protein